MADAIGPGSWVICIDNAPMAGCEWLFPEERPTVGALYQVSDCWIHQTGGPCVSLVGRERRLWMGVRLGYGLWRFRPAFDGDDAALRKTTQPIREDA